MKPLTIEELKALEVGDWVWLIDLKLGVNTGYEQKDEDFNEYADFSNYGKTWLAYKNKEQAEAKGESVKLPCKIGDAVYAVIRCNDSFTIKKVPCSSIEVKAHNFVIHSEIPNFPEYLLGTYLTKSEAERRLAELKKGAQ